MLSDGQIRDGVVTGELGITPYSNLHLNPASYDLTLDPRIRTIDFTNEPLDVQEIESGYTTAVSMDDDGYVLWPGEFILASTIERITLGHNLAARIEGKSSLGRIGLAVHITAGFFDPGWDGECTLEMVNHLPRPIRIRPGMRVAQMAFFRMGRSPEKGYEIRGHYQGQTGPTESTYRMSR